MNAINGIFLAVLIFFGGGYALNKIYKEVKQMAVGRVHEGLPSLSKFTNRLTMSRISNKGELIHLQSKEQKNKKDRRTFKEIE